MKKITFLFAAFFAASLVFAQDPEIMLNVTKISTPPTIDGVAAEDVWSLPTVTEESLKYFAKCEGDNCTPAASDVSGTFKAIWDTAAIYFFVSITDDQLVALDQYTFQQAFKFDCVELFFNTYGLIEDRELNNSNDSAAGISQYRFNYGVSDPSPFTAVAGYNSWTYFERNTSVTPRVFDNRRGVEAAYVPSATGFTMEIKMPWNAIFYNTPDSISKQDEGKVFAFELHYADRDAGDDIDVKAMWNNDSGEEHWNNPIGWSLIELAGKPSSIRSITNGGISVYPNPVLDQVTINGNEVIESYELYNLLGSSVQSEKIGLANFNINMDNLNSSVYLLHLNTVSGEKLVHRLVKN